MVDTVSTASSGFFQQPSWLLSIQRFGDRVMKSQLKISLLASFFTVACFIGCQPSVPTKALSPAVQSDHGKEHSQAGHGAGPHDGAVADWGGGKFHVEFTVDHDKNEATVYVLGGDEKTPAPIKSEKILLNIKDPKFQVELAAKPLDGEKDGLASRFVGNHDSLGKVQEFSGTISGEIDGTPYAGEFAELAHGAHDHK